LIRKLLRSSITRTPAATVAVSHGSSAPALLPLPLLHVGQRAQVDTVLGESELVRRLRELGLSNGAEVCMVRPGCPCIIRMGGQKFCFRADELNTVLVRPGVSH
jgi:Fe2+ transport system protein FeoA